LPDSLDFDPLPTNNNINNNVDIVRTMLISLSKDRKNSSVVYRPSALAYSDVSM